MKDHKLRLCEGALVLAEHYIIQIGHDESFLRFLDHQQEVSPRSAQAVKVAKAMMVAHFQQRDSGE